MRDIDNLLRRSADKSTKNKALFHLSHQVLETPYVDIDAGDTKSDPIILSSDSDENTTDDEIEENDPLRTLNRTFSKTSSTLSSFSNKRSSLFDQKSSDLKKLKSPSPVKAPFIRKNDGSTLRKSAELLKLHEKDEQDAIKKLTIEKPMRDMILEKLDHKAIENRNYVDYLAQHHEDLNLKDFHYIQEAPYVKPRSIRDPIEFYVIPGMFRQNPTNSHEFDVFNELEIIVVEKEIGMIKKEVNINANEINEFMMKLGVSKGMINKEKLTKDDLEIDSKKATQDIRLIVVKFQYLITQVIHSRYNEDKFTQTCKNFGLFMMDNRVSNTGSCLLFSNLLSDLLKWRYDANSDSTLWPIITLWCSLTDELHLLIRIIDTLASDVSDRILQLRKLFSLNIFLQRNLPRTIEDPIKYESGIDDEILKKLNYWNAKGKEFFREGEFHNIRLEFQCLFQCVNLKKDASEKIKEALDDLRTKVSTSFQNSDQAAFKSLLLLIATSLHHDNLSLII